MNASTYTGSVGAGASSHATYVTEHAASSRAAYYGDELSPRHEVDPSIMLRPDLSPEFAAALGIDMSRGLSVDELTNLMDIKTAQGDSLPGRKLHSPHQSVASVFGLSPDRLPSVAEMDHVLAGRRIDGEAPRSDSGNGQPLEPDRVESAQRKFRSAIGLSSAQEVTPEQRQRVADGKITNSDYLRSVNGTSPAAGFVGITLSSDKSVGIVYALEDEAGRALTRAIVERASQVAMRFAETTLGISRSGAQGNGPSVPAELAWVSVTHDDARPTVDIPRLDADGNEYSDRVAVPGGRSDVSLHVHNLVFNTLRSDDGKLRAVDWSKLQGEVKVIGAIFHASIAQQFRQAGAEVSLGPNGEARVGNFSQEMRDFHSRRSVQGEKEAMAYAKSKGIEWERLSGDRRAELLRGGARASREAKPKEEDSGHETPSERLTRWKQDATQAGHRYRSVYHQQRIKPELTPELRIEKAYETSVPLVREAFGKNAVIRESELREHAARGLVVSGIGHDPAADLSAVVMATYNRGLHIDGVHTDLIHAIDFEKKRPVTVISTGRALDMEAELLAVAGRLAADRTGALTQQQVDAGADKLLARSPHIDRHGEQWGKQKQVIDAVGIGPRLTFFVGVGGAGKTSSVVQSLVESWHDQGKTVYGMTVPNRSTAELKAVGVDHAVSITAFVHRVKTGAYTIDSNTIIVADEVSMIGIKQQLELLKITERYGARIVELGDPEQYESVEAPALGLIARAVGDENTPRLLSSIRQKTERDREIAAAFRGQDNQAAKGVSMMVEDGNLKLVAGGDKATITETVRIWREKTDAGEQPVVLTPTHKHAREISVAIRLDMRQRGELGIGTITVPAYNPSTKERYNIDLSVGDKLRPFKQWYDADVPKREPRRLLANNGEPVEITAISQDGVYVRSDRGEGRVDWAGMKQWRAAKTEPVEVSYAHAVTAYSTQSKTLNAPIVSLPAGSQGLESHGAYTAGSRGIGATVWVISDAAERAAIVRRQEGIPTRADVINHVADNLGRYSNKQYATDLRQERVKSQAIDEAREFTASVEKRDLAQSVKQDVPEQSQAERDSAWARASTQPREQSREQAREGQRQEHHRGPSLGR